jgi:hypothetical protein
LRQNDAKVPATHSLEEIMSADAILRFIGAALLAPGLLLAAPAAAQEPSSWDMCNNEGRPIRRTS